MAIHRPTSAAWAVVRRRSRDGTLAELSSLTRGGFARIVAEVLRQRGYHFVYIQPWGPTRDAPGYILAKDPEGRRVLVACWGYRAGEKVTVSELRTFTERLADHPTAELGIVVTTSSFATGAWVDGLRRRIQLIDGTDLVRLLASTTPVAPAPAPRRRLEWSS